MQNFFNKQNIEKQPFTPQTAWQNRTLFLFLMACFAFLNGCAADGKQGSETAATTTKDRGQSTTPITQNQAPDFEIKNTVIQTTVGKTAKLCVPIQTQEANPFFKVTLSRSALFGKVTPSVSGNQICFEYTPPQNFKGKDQFDCTICSASGICHDETWYADVVETTAAAAILPQKTEAAEPTKTSKKRAQPKVKMGESLPIYVPAARPSIFDNDKKNTDGYVPKN